MLPDLRLSVLLLSIVPVVLGAAADPGDRVDPGTPAPAGQEGAARMRSRGRALIEALRSGDVERYRAFRAEHLAASDASEEEWKASFRSLVERFGAFEAHELEPAGPTELRWAVETEDAGGPSYVLELGFEPQPPHRIVSIGLAVTTGGGPREGGLPAPELDPGASAAEVRAALDRYLGELAARDVYSGTAYVARGDEVLYEGAHGLASRSFGVPNTTSTRFRVGSITKDFTRVAVGQLVAAGRLDPRDTVAEILPDYPNPDVARRITVDQLLRHESGLGGMGWERFVQLASRRFRAPSDYFELFADEPLLFEPGTEQRYSNAGYIVLGAIVEAASGESYFDYVREHVFAAAGMEDSDFLALDRPHPNVAVGYWRADPESDDWYNNYYVMEIEGGPSGGSYSTARDLSRFERALRGCELLSPAYTRWFFTEEWPARDDLEPPAAWPPRGSAGGAEGVSAVVLTDGPWFVCVLCNLEEGIAEDVGQALLQAFRERGERQAYR